MTQNPSTQTLLSRLEPGEFEFIRREDGRFEIRNHRGLVVRVFLTEDAAENWFDGKRPKLNPKPFSGPYWRF